MRRFYLLAAAAPLALGSPAAIAQPSTDQGTSAAIPEMIVTAQKREEKLQDVPIAISAISAESLAKQNVKSALDVKRLGVPGLVTAEQTGQPVSGFTMRGVSAQDVQATIEAGVAVYIDGVYIPRNQGLAGDLYEVDRIEVLRGPQGTLFGRNAEGGAISIVSKQPTGVFGGTIGGGATTKYGGNNQYARVNLPEFANLSVKVTGYRERFDGWTKNAALAPGQVLSEHRNFGEKDNYGGSVQILWRPSDTFSALFSADKSRLRNSPTYLLFDTASPFSSVDPSFKRESDIPLYNPYQRDNVSGVSMVLTYEANENLTLKSITARRNVYSGGGSNLRFYGATPASSITGVYADFNVSSKTLSQEFQAIGTAGRIEYTVGAFYFREQASDRRANFGTIAILPGGIPFSVNPVDFNAESIQSTESKAYAVYGQATWTPPVLNDKLKITLGGRYSEDEKTAARTVAASTVLATPIRPSPSKASRFDPSMTIAYEATQNVNFYARYAQSFRAGGVSVRSSSFRTFGIETIRAIEGGMKSELFDRRLRLNTAIWKSWVYHQQISAIPPDDPTQQDIINAEGSTKLYGFEMEATVAPVTGLTLSGSLGLMNGSQPPFNCGGCTDSQITYLPRTILGFVGDYTRPIGEFGAAFIHVDWKYMSEFHTSPLRYAGQLWPKSGADVWNFRTGIRDIPVGPVHANVSFYIDNVFDNHEIIFDTDVQFQTRRNPRLYGFDASIDF